MEREAAAAAYQALHQEQGYHDGTFTRWAAERSAAYPYPAMAGVSIGAAANDLAPWDTFTTEVDASPAGPVSVADESG